MYTSKFSHIQQISLVNLIKIPFNLNIILYHSKFTLISDYNSADILHSHDISYLITNMYFLLWNRSHICYYIWAFFICKYVTYHKYYIHFLYIISKTLPLIYVNPIIRKKRTLMIASEFLFHVQSYISVRLSEYHLTSHFYFFMYRCCFLRFYQIYQHFC